MKTIFCTIFGFVMGVVVGVFCYHLHNEKKKTDKSICCQNSENEKTLTAFGYI